MSTLHRAVGAVAAALLGVLAGLAALETIAWMAFGASHAAIAEVEELLLVWLGGLSAAWVLGERQHLALTLAVDRLPRRLRSIVGWLADGLVLTFGVLLTVFGLGLCQRVHNTLPATGLPAALGYLPIAATGALLVLFAMPGVVARGAPGDTD